MAIKIKGTTILDDNRNLLSGNTVTASSFVGPLTGTASTANTLTTARTLWGQSFNGSGNISGNLSSVGNITGSSAITIAAGGTNQSITLTPSGTGTVNAPTFNATSTTNGGFQGIEADTVSAPSFTWTNDLNTGMYHPGSDTIGFTAGGVVQAEITNTGLKSVKGIEGGYLQGYKDYSLLIEFGSNAAGTWKKIVDVTCQNTTYSTIGFTIDIIDNSSSYALSSTAGTNKKETYYVICARSDAATLNSPDACYVRGPSSLSARIRAVKTATGVYEIQITNDAQYREYRVDIKVHAVSGSHTVTYSEGGTASTGTAQYNAVYQTGNVDYFASISALELATIGDINIGEGTTPSSLVIKKSGTTADDIQFFNGTTRVGEIGTQDTTWLRINQVTAKNIYTPRQIRADGGLQTTTVARNVDNDVLVLVGGTSTGANIELYGPTHATLANTAYYDADLHTFRTASSSSTVVTIDSGTGNVGIGTTTPSQKLHVVGAIKTPNGFMFGATESYMYENAANSIAWRIGSDGPYVSLTDSGSGVATLNNASGGLALGSVGTTVATFNSAGITMSSGVYTSTAANTRDKIRVWNSGAYTIGMQNSVTYGSIANNYAMTFQMDNTTGRGFWWGDSSHTPAQGAMSLSNQGHLTVATAIRVGYGESDTTIANTNGVLDVKGDVLIESDVSTNLILSTFVGNTNDSTFVLRKARGGASGPTVITAGDDLGTISFQGYNGTSYAEAAYIRADSGSNATTFLNGELALGTNGNERFRIDYLGRVGIGTTTPQTNLQINSGAPTISWRENEQATDEKTWDIIANSKTLTIRTVNDAYSAAGNCILFNRGTGTALSDTRFYYGTNSEAMRINSAGALLFGASIGLGGTENSNPGMTMYRGGSFIVGSTGQYEGIYVAKIGATATPSTLLNFAYNGVSRGSITTNGSSVTYNTTSDYRLKENVTEVTNATERLLQLKPSNFNFIGSPDKIDGFIAHEVQEIVPQAVTGEKDALDEEGNPRYQGIDQSQLVPLLTAALQDALKRIDALEQKLNN